MGLFLAGCKDTTPRIFLSTKPIMRETFVPMDEFKKNHNATCCRVLTAGMDMASPERKAHCANMVDECSKILEEIIKVKV